MRPRQYTLTPGDVEQCASTCLQDHVKIEDHVKLKDHGPKLRAIVSIQVVVCAAGRLLSIHRGGGAVRRGGDHTRAAICQRLAETKFDSDSLFRG